MKLCDFINNCNLLYIKIAVVIGDSLNRMKSYSANIVCLSLNYLKLI